MRLGRTLYDPVSNAIASVSPLGLLTTQVFDVQNRLLAWIDPLGRCHTLAYDNAGRLLSEQDAKGQITTHSYVPCGDELTRLYADGTRLTFAYDSLRQLVGVQEPTGRFTLGYDALGRLQSLLTPNHPTGQPLTRVYDGVGNLVLLQSCEVNPHNWTQRKPVPQSPIFRLRTSPRKGFPCPEHVGVSRQPSRPKSLDRLCAAKKARPRFAENTIAVPIGSAAGSRRSKNKRKKSSIRLPARTPVRSAANLGS